MHKKSIPTLIVVAAFVAATGSALAGESCDRDGDCWRGDPRAQYEQGYSDDRDGYAMPTDPRAQYEQGYDDDWDIHRPSTPAEQAQTRDLNEDVLDSDAAADAQSEEDDERYDAEQQRYEEQQDQYAASRYYFEREAQRYEAERDRYAAERARYRRETWPARYERRVVVDANRLVGARVQLTDGEPIGVVADLARAPDGSVDALRVSLGRRDPGVWIEARDIRFDPDAGIVVTDLRSEDLREMARERY